MELLWLVTFGNPPSFAQVDCVPAAESGPFATPESLLAFVERVIGERTRRPLFAVAIPFPKIDDDIVVARMPSHGTISAVTRPAWKIPMGDRSSEGRSRTMPDGR